MLNVSFRKSSFSGMEFFLSALRKIQNPVDFVLFFQQNFLNNVCWNKETAERINAKPKWSTNAFLRNGVRKQNIWS